MAPTVRKATGASSGAATNGGGGGGKTFLPNKESALFTKLIQEYESKKYKSGIKTADQILKKFPEHGETLCMKGLIVASLNKPQEGLELAKQGLRHNLTSFISWHALGILNRMIKNYQESIKCYAQALRIEGGSNINLVRESAYLYIQLRDWPKVVEHRTMLLRMQPHLRMNWIGLAVALHLGGNHTDALRVLEHFETVHRDVPKRSFEQSEVYLYHAQVLLDAQRFQDAIDYLAAKRSDQVLDIKASELLRAKCLLALHEQEKAQNALEGLLKRNEEERKYIVLWLRSKGVDVTSTDVDRQAAATALKQLQTQFPTSRAVKRMTLTYASGDEFRQEASVYILSAVQKGIPSIFNDVRALYAIDDAKRIDVEQIVEEARAQWSAPESDQPTSLLWATFFLAQHYVHLGQHKRALEYIHKAITHTPTLPELHLVRARIYKKAGALLWASRAMEDARTLDGQDRSLNCKSVKYLLRIGDIEAASEKAGLFTKPDVPDPVADLVEMQATWYLIEDARAWHTKGNIAMALKRCTQIDRIYTEIWDDQLDFHSYITRKFTLRAYVDMIHFEDGLRAHHAYVKAATMAIGILLKLHDTPSLYKAQNGTTNGTSSADAASQTSDGVQKKEGKKNKKQEQRAAADEAAKKAAAASSAGKNDDEAEGAGQTKDEDPDGKVFLKTLEPLQEAKRYIDSLQQHAPTLVQTWLLTYEVALRGRDWLAAVKAVARAHAIDANHADVHVALVQLRTSLPDLSKAPEAVAESIAAVLDPIVPAQDQLEAFRAQFVQRNERSGEAQLAAARSLVFVRHGGDSLATVAGKGGKELSDALINLAKQAADGKVVASLTTLERALALLDHNDEARTDYTRAANAAYPFADAFKTQEQLKQEAIDRENEERDWAYAPSDQIGALQSNGGGGN